MSASTDNKRPREQPQTSTDNKRPRGLCDLESIRDELRRFAVAREWDQFHTPRNLVLALTGEVGELAECFQWKSDVECADGLASWDEKKKVHLGEELADVACYLIRLADKCCVDLPEAIEKKLAKNAAKYPADRVRGSAKKYNEYEEYNEQS